jgi:hypothetical protein
MIKRTETIYRCERNKEKPDIYDDFSIKVDQCVFPKSGKQYIQVGINPERWRELDEAIGFYEWVLSELKQFKKTGLG